MPMSPFWQFRLTNPLSAIPRNAIRDGWIDLQDALFGEEPLGLVMLPSLRSGSLQPSRARDYPGIAAAGRIHKDLCWLV